jgi:two-component system sensor kinase FixL
LNQPLTAISLYATTAQSLFEKDSPKIDRVADVLQKLTMQSHRAGAVLERMQKMTKHRESYQETVDCKLMMEEVHKLAEAEARQRNFTIELAIDKNLPKAHCDAIQIQQVILNLLRNGMEAVEQPDEMGETITIKAENRDDLITISIVDGGCGISKSSAEKLYQPFLSSKQEGMGLGLSISKSIINAHGSELAFKNNPDIGATFYFTLPLALHES